MDDVRSLEDVQGLLDWLTAERNRDLWLMLTYMLSYDHDETYDVVQWIVSQDDCDQATAFAALAMTHGYECIDDPEHGDDRTRRIATIVCERFTSGKYANNELRVAPTELVGEELQPDTIGRIVDERCAARLDAGQSLALPVPMGLFTTDYSKGREPDSGYVVDEAAIYPKAMFEAF